MVSASATEELIIGAPARSFHSLMQPMLDVIKPHICHIYAHLGRMSVKVNDETVAQLLCEKAKEFLFIGQEVVPLNASVKQTEDRQGLDVWYVDIELKTTSTLHA